ncbi:MAG: uroporphyrinogen-III synthase [Zoogloeaceae bacterium]|nr:uroporphyrinogen-III synthase [Zoogloeaceae bacterium]
MQHTLVGKTVVVTRPQAQADALCEAVEARGGRALRFPVLGIAPAPDAGPLEAATARLDEFDIAFFVSPNAVDFALRYILARRGWPAGLVVATVGGGSERALRRMGFAHVVAPASGFDTEAVLALPEFSARSVRGRSIVVFRGDGGRDLLGEELTRRGAKVEYVTVYRRYCPVADCAELLAAARAGALDAIVLTSSEGVRNLASMLGSDGLAAMREVTVFAPHPRIAGFAFEAGFRRVVETDAGDAGILSGLERGLATRPPAGAASS